MSFANKLASLKADAMSEIVAEEGSPNKQKSKPSYWRTASTIVQRAAPRAAPPAAEQPPYVFNFNDIPTITSDLQGIKSLEASILGGKGDGNDERPMSPSKVTSASAAALRKPTLVQPKGPGEEFGNMDQDRVRGAFTKTDFMGIRSLPNALEPNFRETLYQEVLGLTAVDMNKQRELTCQRGQNALLAATQTMFSHSESVGPGQKRAGRLSALPGEITGAFSTFEHHSSPYDIESELRQAELAERKTRMLSESDFIVRTIQRPVHSGGAFSTPEYGHNPYEDLADMQKELDKMTKDTQLENCQVPWMTSGKTKPIENQKIHMKECMSAIGKYCMENWPNSFMRLFEDKTGCLVMEFDAHAAEEEGDLTSFMNHMAKAYITVLEFQLKRDPTKWGLITEGGDSPSAYYVMWPPWVSHYISPPEHLTGPVPQATKLLWETRPPLPADRVPFIVGRPFDGNEYINRIDEKTFR